MDGRIDDGEMKPDTSSSDESDIRVLSTDCCLLFFLFFGYIMSS